MGVSLGASHVTFVFALAVSSLDLEVLPQLCNSWIILRIYSYMALAMTPKYRLYRVGGVPNLYPKP